MIRRIGVPALACLLLAASPGVPAKTKPFSGAELMTGRGIKPPAETQVVQFGLDVGTSPMASLLGYVKEDIQNRAIAQCNQEGIPDCAAAVKTAMNQLKNVPPSTWDMLQ